MKKLLSSMLALALLACSATGLSAQEAEKAAGDAEIAAKPMFVLSLSGYAELRSDLELLGELAENPELASSLEGVLKMMTRQDEPLAGLDVDRPWGVVMIAGPQGFQPLAFLPVNDASQLLGNLSGVVGEAEEVGDGIKKIESPQAPIFVKEHEGWAFIGQTAETLLNLPDDPASYLAGLEKTYDLALRIYVQNIPEFFRDFAFDRIKDGLEQSLRKNEGESDEQFQIRAGIARAQVAQFIEASKSIDELTVGLSIDGTGKRLILDLTASAVEGSDMARQLAATNDPLSKLAGFIDRQALFSAHANGAVRPEDSAQVEPLVKTLREQLKAGIEDSSDLADEPQTRDVVKGLVDEFADVLEATLKKGHLNFGLAVFGEGPLDVVAGGLVASGADFEKILKDLVELGKEEPDFPEFKLNVEKYKDISFHTAKVVLPSDAGAEARKLFGDEPTVTFGFGKETVFLALGDNGVASIKKILDDSSNPPGKLDPGRFSLKLAPLMRIASQSENGNPLAELAAGIEGDKDHLNITTSLNDGVVRYRIEAEEQVLKFLGQAASRSVQGAGALAP